MPLRVVNQLGAGRPRHFLLYFPDAEIVDYKPEGSAARFNRA